MTALDVLPATKTSSLDGEPYVAYSYSYPHKSAYGPFTPPVALGPLWRAEDREALFLYVHLPFCEMRCGFCNLFARAHAEEQLVDAYLAALERQAQETAHFLEDFTFARLAVGGGTPTYLSPRQLNRVFDCLEGTLHLDPKKIPASVETSPKTATPERLAVLHERGIERVSIGVQSFDDGETHALGRPQCSTEVHAALERLRAFPLLNIDLIYGHSSQTTASWLHSVRTALRYEPQELFLYPLYVRPQTGLGRHVSGQRSEAGRTRQQYRAARDVLLSASYEQVSMRCFRKPAPAREGVPPYCCQSDGMIGLGCGARSYTPGLHYADRFAVEAASVHALIDEWIVQPRRAFRQATWGIRLNVDERRRRYVIQSLLHCEGLNEAAYAAQFGEMPEEHFAELRRWADEGMLSFADGNWHLTELGVEFSDSLGPALYSDACRSALEDFVRP